MTDPTSPTQPAPELEEDPRFTYGLTFDVAAVLVAHGYPEPEGVEMAKLMSALFRLLYPRPASGLDAQ